MIPYRIEHSRNRHSRAFVKDDTIIIRLAKNLSTREEQEHVNNLLRRMVKQVNKEHKRTRVDPFRMLLDGENSATIETVTGHTYEFRLEPGERTKAKATMNGWLIEVGPHMKRATLNRFLWKLIAEKEKSVIDRLVREINARTIDVHVARTRLQYASSQWGSCSPYGIIMINTALLFTSPELLEYVIIHELSHRRQRNHSATYWRVVESVLPNYDEMRKKLRNYRLTSL